MLQMNEIPASSEMESNEIASEVDMKSLKALLDKAQERFQIPAYSVTLYKEGTYTHLSYGYRDLDGQIETDHNTLYAIGSCTKSLTVGALCTLIDKGMLSLEDRVRDYIPEFEMADYYVTDHLTVRDILCHRSGLGGHDFSWYSRLDTLTEKEVIEMFRYLPLTQPFRYKWQYSNHMYALAGYLIERVSGETWRDVLRKNILMPLGIDRVALSTSDAISDDNCAIPYILNEESDRIDAVAHADIGVMGSAGCIYMSSADLAKWDALLLNGGVYEGKQIISKALCDQMMSPQMYRDNAIIEPLKDFTQNRAYGLGLEMEIFRGRRMVYHSGHIDGFSAHQTIVPEEDIACSVLTNLGDHSGATIMSYMIVEYCLGGGEDWLEKISTFLDGVTKQQLEMIEQAKHSKPDNAPCPVELKRAEGTYRHPGYGTMEIQADLDKLVIQFGTHTFSAVHYAHQHFFLEPTNLTPNTYIETNLDIDIQGNVIAFEITFEGIKESKIRFERQ
ncbi:serine hydrolase [Fusibacter ferrireducens]|uniref:Serine hydrolase n=1 Tax=Fusibacter ferrireducens TaxID=2785058 RepID=A0ABR9ZPD3_9FIRM|nr:serine hydrolase [Fusibacter ferrireducens]MBF4692332.1 serine hydrolase [Fusibacter ferrireducens]